MANKLFDALALHQAGQLDQAERLYREILASEPEHADALHLLGTIFQRKGRYADAAALIHQAILHCPDFAEYHSNLASVLFDLGDFAGCQHHCETAIRLKPGFPQAHNNLGNALQGLGRFEESLASYDQAVRCDPGYAQAHANRGGLLQRMRRYNEAEASCRQALAIRPDMPDAWNHLGEICRGRGQPHEAVGYFEKAVRIRPELAELHNNLGNACRESGRLEDAIVSYRRALSLRPAFAQALNNLGVALREQGHWEGAAESLHQAIATDAKYAPALENLADILRRQERWDEAEARYVQAAKLVPRDGGILNNLGEIRWKRGQWADAIRCFQQAIEYAPQLPSAHHNLGNALREQGQLEAAAASYHAALKCDPEFAPACNNLALTLSEQGKINEAHACFGRAVALQPGDPRVHSHWVVSSQYLPGVSLAQLARDHEQWNTRHALQHKSHWPKHAHDRNPDRPLRLGFVSRDFRRHPVGYFLAPVLEQLDPASFQPYCYYDQQAEDDVTRRIRAAAFTWRTTHGLLDDALAAQIRADGIDLLVDLAGHTAAHRLTMFARKPAPVQATWMGYVGTTGLTAIDYLISDHFHTPAGADLYYCERIWRMPNGYVCYEPPSDAPPVVSLPAKRSGRVTFGSFNNPAKISAAAISLWARVLAGLPDSRLVLKYAGLEDAGTQDHMLGQFARAGIASHRVELRGPSSHRELLANYNEIDIALDTLPYSGGLTTCEALWMGVPVLTCPGETFAGRHALSHLSNAGLSEWVARDPDDFVARARRWAGDLEALSALRQSLRGRMAASALCHTAGFAEALATAFRAMWRDGIQAATANRPEETSP